jgi:hypothetical protein
MDEAPSPEVAIHPTRGREVQSIWKRLRTNLASSHASIVYGRKYSWAIPANSMDKSFYEGQRKLAAYGIHQELPLGQEVPNQ